ncbi:MAG: hypothetical protein K0R46_2383 [Herbinix sp.]|jgi:hypothetical protein|nr:hypothetical protein [Herbinix sp.]
MFQPGEDWNPLQARLNGLIKKKDHFEEMQKLLLGMHSLLHSKEVYGGSENTFMDELWEGLEDKAFRTMPTSKDDTIAWNIWHITRIEDLTANFLIVGQEQVLDLAWQERLNTKVTDTGNSMTDEEIIAFSKEVSKEGLYEYRKAVGRRTKEILEGLIPEELKRKVPKEGIVRIAEVGGVAQHPDAIWLLDFWGKKTVAGILQMPITRHQIVHLNASGKLKQRIK